MRNLLKNLYTTFESNAEKMLTPHEQNVADSVFHFLNHELEEMKAIIIEEVNAQKKEEKDPSPVPRTNYDVEKMEKVFNLVTSVSMGINFLSVQTSQIIMQRGQSSMAKMMLTPQELCYVRGKRKLDPSTIAPVHPHEVKEYSGNFPPSFKQSMKRIHALLDQENVFAIFAPVYPLLGKSLQNLYVITS